MFEETYTRVFDELLWLGVLLSLQIDHHQIRSNREFHSFISKKSFRFALLVRTLKHIKFSNSWIYTHTIITEREIVKIYCLLFVQFVKVTTNCWTVRSAKEGEAKKRQSQMVLSLWEESRKWHGKKRKIVSHRFLNGPKITWENKAGVEHTIWLEEVHVVKKSSRSPRHVPSFISS